MSTASTPSETVEITVNGEAHDVPAGATITDLLRAVDRDPEQPGVAVAVEGEVVRREGWEDTVLAGGEAVEIVAAQQGG